MPLSSRFSLLLLLLLFTTFAPVAAAADAAVGRSSAQLASAAPMSPRVRGEYARRFVQKWGAYAERAEGVPVAVWAKRMVPSFVAADPANLRQALQHDSFDAALATLVGGNSRSAQAKKVAASRAQPGIASAARKALGDVARDLVYTPVQPCRILDTRNAGGPILANSSRDFIAAFPSSPTVGDYTQQGGSNTNCGMGQTAATAVVLNLTAVTPDGAGFATVYTASTPRPFAASVNYAAGAIVNNTVIVRIPDTVSPADFSIYSFAQSHYVADIVGYFSAPQKTFIECPAYVGAANSVPAFGIGSALAPSCPSDYTVAGVECDGSAAGLNLIETQGCTWSNTTDSPKVVQARTICCRVPGR